MAVTKQERKEIKQCIVNIDKFRTWFRRLPEERLDLDRVMRNREGESIVCRINRKELDGCGAAGCVLGWLRHYLYLQGMPDIPHTFVGHKFNEAQHMFRPQIHEDMHERDEALGRLREQIKALKGLL